MEKVENWLGKEFLTSSKLNKGVNLINSNFDTLENRCIRLEERCHQLESRCSSLENLRIEEGVTGKPLGYIKLPGGNIIQWGKSKSSQKSPGAVVKLPIAFKNKDYTIVASGAESTTQYDSEFSCTKIDEQSFNLRYGGRNDFEANWIAIGC